MRCLSHHANYIVNNKGIESLSQQRCVHLHVIDKACEQALLCKETCLILCQVGPPIYQMYCAIQRDNHIYTSSKSTRSSFKNQSKERKHF